MKKIVVILFTLLTCYSFGQTIHSNNLYTRMQIFKGWITVRDTAFNVSRDSDSLTISIRNDKANFYYTGDSINFYGTGGAVAKTNIGGGSSASGPAYSIQWRDPSGDLHGSPNLKFDTTYADDRFHLHGDFFMGNSTDSVASIYSDLSNNFIHIDADVVHVDGNYIFGVTADSSVALYSNIANDYTVIAADSVLLTSLEGVGNRLVYSNAQGRLLNASVTSPLLFSSGALSIPNAAADGSTKGAASFTANDFNSSSGNISIDYTNGQLASAGQNGFLRSSDFTTFNKFNRYATTVALKFDDAGSGTLTELFDEFTNTFSLNDIGDGSYTITAGSGIFTADKTFVTFSDPIIGQTTTFEYTVSSTTTIDFNVYSIGDAGIRNDFATNIQIIITVYP